MSSRPELIRALVDLGEAYEIVNSRTFRETEQRAELDAVPRPGVAIVVILLQDGSATDEGLRALTGQPTQMLRKSIAVLKRQGVVRETLERGERHYVPTQKAVGVRELGRERSSKAIRYALAHLTEAQQAELESALGAMLALTHGLGLRDFDA